MVYYDFSHFAGVESDLFNFVVTSAIRSICPCAVAHNKVEVVMSWCVRNTNDRLIVAELIFWRKLEILNISSNRIVLLCESRGELLRGRFS